MSAPEPTTHGVCACGHGEHAHELKRDNVTRSYCTHYRCPCREYDERERYSLRLIKRPVQ